MFIIRLELGDINNPNSTPRHDRHWHLYRGMSLPCEGHHDNCSCSPPTPGNCSFINNLGIFVLQVAVAGNPEEPRKRHPMCSEKLVTQSGILSILLCSATRGFCTSTRQEYEHSAHEYNCHCLRSTSLCRQLLVFACQKGYQVSAE